MRTRRYGWGLAISALLSAVYGVADAQAPKPNADTSVGMQRQVNLSPQEQLAQADAFVARMGVTGGSVRRMLEQARAQRDVVKTLCLNDKLNQIDVATRSAQDRRASLEQASLRMSVVYDAGLLVAADRSDREVWADHRARLEVGVVPLTTAPVVAQVSRSTRQVQLRRFLRGCDIIGFTREEPHEVGILLSRAETADVVDAHVVLTASRRGSTVLTSDAQDLQRLSDCLPEPIVIRPIAPGRRRKRP